MKTPLQELITTLNDYYNSESFPSSEKSGIKLAIDCAMQLIEKEKGEIESAFMRGCISGTYISPFEYYRKSYGNN
jgi:hypothetical protein